MDPNPCCQVDNAYRPCDDEDTGDVTAHTDHIVQHTTRTWSMPEAIKHLNEISQPTTRQSVPIDFDPDDYPLHPLITPENAAQCEEKIAELRRTHGPAKSAGELLPMRTMIVCQVCGHKRSPRASDLRHICTGSNEPKRGKPDIEAIRKQADFYQRFNEAKLVSGEVSDRLYHMANIPDPGYYCGPAEDEPLSSEDRSELADALFELTHTTDAGKVRAATAAVRGILDPPIPPEDTVRIYAPPVLSPLSAQIYPELVVESQSIDCIAERWALPWSSVLPLVVGAFDEVEGV